MSTRIVTDSTCDLPERILSSLSIAVVPLYINFGAESYLDGVDISRETFYQRLPGANPPPTTAVPGTMAFLGIYRRLAAEGATEIISIHVAETLSGVADAARLAARESPVPVSVVDSGSLTMGLGFIVWEAAQAAAQGATGEEVLARIPGHRRRTHVCAALDTLEFLRRSGRLSSIVARLGDWLRLRPLLKMTDGETSLEPVRTTSAATGRLLALLGSLAPLEKVALLHTHALERVAELQEKACNLLAGIEVISVDVTPILGTHLGPNAVGFACLRAE